MALAVLALALAPVAAAMPFRAGFVPGDPLAPKQYYLTQDHAFDAFPAELPVVNPVRVAIIDSGIDGGHPEFRNRIWLARSWVGGRADTDEEGHGTLTQQRLHQLIRQPGPVARRTFEITFLDAGAGAYAFTFG